jgi:hypothetical protein
MEKEATIRIDPLAITTDNTKPQEKSLPGGLCPSASLNSSESPRRFCFASSYDIFRWPNRRIAGLWAS